ncbi:hypothetical protein Pmani_002141 [Petrolisthes manimaculis]|uniref:Uncharacterized protein n=1 Tax=Petrolisthes manimaculis TaxID=1843537 RepID=A0AAE1UKP7_9EUCA|nr:hypothetical protein Pmani_002141 [Petrolisthes manimaculis]
MGGQGGTGNEREGRDGVGRSGRDREELEGQGDESGAGIVGKIRDRNGWTKDQGWSGMGGLRVREGWTKGQGGVEVQTSGHKRG